MRVSILFAIFAVVLTRCRADDDDHSYPYVHSNDELKLTYSPQGEAGQLYGKPGDLRHFAMNLYNGGPTDNFKIDVSTNHESFKGKYDDEVEVRSGSVQTLLIRDLSVPASADDDEIEIVVSAERKGLSLNSKMKEVSTTLLFTVVDDGNPYEEDEEVPEAEKTHSGECPEEALNSTARCSGFSWHVEFKIKDEDSGLRLVEVTGVGPEAAKLPQPVQYEYPGFAIGTTDEVELTTDASCCLKAIKLTAIDMAGNQADIEYLQGQDASASLVASVATVIASVVFTTLAKF